MHSLHSFSAFMLHAWWLQVEEVKEGEAYTMSSTSQTVSVTAGHLDTWRKERAQSGLPAAGQFDRGVQLATEAGCE